MTCHVCAFAARLAEIFAIIAFVSENNLLVFIVTDFIRQK